MKHVKTLIGLLAVCLLMVLMFRWFEHSQVYHPDRVLTATGAELGRPFEDVSFKAGDGVELNGWFFPANTNSPRSHLAVLVCHGNAGNIGHRLDTCAALLATGGECVRLRLSRLWAEPGPPERGRHISRRAGCVSVAAAARVCRARTSLPSASRWAAASRRSWQCASRWAGWCCKARSRASRTSAPSCSRGCRCAGSADPVRHAQQAAAPARSGAGHAQPTG